MDRKFIVYVSKEISKDYLRSRKTLWGRKFYDEKKEKIGRRNNLLIHAAETFSLRRMNIRIFIGARVAAHIFEKRTVCLQWPTGRNRRARFDVFEFGGNDAARSRIPVQLTRPAALSKRKYRRPLKIYHRGPFFPPSRL